LGGVKEVFMSGTNELEKMILDELQKTGYPTEISSASVMQKNEWSILHNPSFWDKEEKQSREFDIRAYKDWKNPTEDTNIGVFLITECKKSDKPWVFFTTNEDPLDSRIGKYIKVRSTIRNMFTNMESNENESVISDDELRTIHHYFKMPRKARAYFEPLKQNEKSGHSPMIYTAVMSTIKATLFHYSERAYGKWTNIYYPLIIYNGNLFDACVKPDKTIDLIPALHIQLAFNYIHNEPSAQSSIWSLQKRFIVDIIQESYLEQFLKIIEDEHKIIASKV
jgi:hypothetical protein